MGLKPAKISGAALAPTQNSLTNRLVQMTLLGRTYDQLVSVLETAAGAADPTVAFTSTSDYCHHCGEQTEWYVSVLHQFYLCTQCRRDPKLPTSHYEADAPASDADRAVKHSAEPRMGQESGSREVAPVGS